MSHPQPGKHVDEVAGLSRMLEPITAVSAGWPQPKTNGAGAMVLAETHRLQRPCWTWNEDAWVALVTRQRSGNHRFPLAAFGYISAGTGGCTTASA